MTKSELIHNLHQKLATAIAAMKTLLAPLHPEASGRLYRKVVSSVNVYGREVSTKTRNFDETRLWADLSSRLSWCRISLFPSTQENVQQHEIAILSTLVAHFRPKKAFEIGTWNGYTTLHIAANLAPESIIFTLDLPPSISTEAAEMKNRWSRHSAHDDRLTIERGRGAGIGALFSDWTGNRVVQLWGDSATFDFSPYTGGIDFCFVDGSHSYLTFRTSRSHFSRIRSAAASPVCSQSRMIWSSFRPLAIHSR